MILRMALLSSLIVLAANGAQLDKRYKAPQEEEAVRRVEEELKRAEKLPPASRKRAVETLTKRLEEARAKLGEMRKFPPDEQAVRRIEDELKKAEKLPPMIRKKTVEALTKKLEVAKAKLAKKEPKKKESAEAARLAREREAERKKVATAFLKKQEPRLAKLAPADRVAVERVIEKNTKATLALRRPVGLASGTGSARVVRLPAGTKTPGGAVRSFRMSVGTFRQLDEALGKGGAEDKETLRKIRFGELLAPPQQERLRTLAKSAPPAKAAAIRAALKEDGRRRILVGLSKGLKRGLKGSKGSTVVTPPRTPFVEGKPGDKGETPAKDTLASEDGEKKVPPTPGVDPNAPATVTPEDKEKPDGPATVASVDPESVEPGEATEKEKKEEGMEEKEDEEPAPLDAVPQETRKLRVGNGTKVVLKVFIQYEAIDKEGKTRWFPERPDEGEKALEVEVQPGEVAEVKDGDWQVNAARVRIWAKGEGAEYKAFKEEDMDLVPERGEDGERGYFSPSVQTMNVSFR